MSHQQAANVLTTDEKERLDALKQGDEKAFDALFREWYPPLVRFAISFTDGDMDAAEDIVQNVFVKFWENRQTIDFQHSIKAYFYKMTSNLALNRIRSSKVHDRFVAHQGRNGVGYSFDLTEMELERHFQNALESLPPQCRQVFELSRFEELKYREIGEQLSISVKTVETHMSKALRILRRELADFLGAILLIINHLWF